MNAVIKDGVWYENGRMGYFDYDEEDMDKAEWRKIFWNLFDVPDDTPMQVFSLHI